MQIFSTELFLCAAYRSKSVSHTHTIRLVDQMRKTNSNNSIAKTNVIEIPMVAILVNGQWTPSSSSSSSVCENAINVFWLCTGSVDLTQQSIKNYSHTQNSNKLGSSIFVCIGATRPQPDDHSWMSIHIRACSVYADATHAGGQFYLLRVARIYLCLMHVYRAVYSRVQFLEFTLNCHKEFRRKIQYATK